MKIAGAHKGAGGQGVAGDIACIIRFNIPFGAFRDGLFICCHIVRFAGTLQPENRDEQAGEVGRIHLGRAALTGNVFPVHFFDVYGENNDDIEYYNKTIADNGVNIIASTKRQQTFTIGDKTFTVGVFLDGHELGEGIGKSKKAAETAAASDALSKLAI